MIYLLEISNISIVYIILFLLTLIVIAIFWLVYMQHKEMLKVLSSLNKSEDKEVNNDINNIENDYWDIEKVNRNLDDEINLKALSQELEGNEIIHSTVIDSFEEEQEEYAIISYDELIKRKDKTVEQGTSNGGYEKEESFLNKLKDLNNNLK